jgi:type IV pilus assembly protein PilO
MASFSEMSKTGQVGVLMLFAVLITAGLYFGFYKSIADENAASRAQLVTINAQVQELRRYQSDMPRLNQQIYTLQQQLEIQKRIVPDEKEADQLIHVLQNTAQSAGIEIRRWTAKPSASREYYVEVPFDLELDGPYYSVLNFFDRVAHLERIINVSGLQLNTLKGESGAKRGYKYASQESVTGVCTATTYFSHDAGPAPVAAKK